MGANIVCVTSSGGLPIFSRKTGNVESLSFSTIGSLNGVHMFGKTKNLLLDSTETDTSVIVWKEYNESINLICVAQMNGKELVEEVLESIYHALLLFTGESEMRHFKNVERFKRSLKPAYPIIDCILECLDFGDRNMYPDLLGLVETLLCRESKILQESLDHFMDVIGSEFGCLTIENCIVSATGGWWDLTHIEKKLLSYAIKTRSYCTCFDMPIYLSFKSPLVPLRLVSVCLIGMVRLNVLVGSTPDLTTISQKCHNCWAPLVETLKSAILTYPRNIPTNVELHDSVHGFMLANIIFGKYLLCTSLKSTKKDSKSCSEILKTFYYQAASIFFKTGTEKSHKPTETYFIAEYHKLHALKIEDNVICVLYHSAVPTPCMRLISRETFDIITTQLGSFGWNQEILK